MQTKTCIRLGITVLLVYLCIHYLPSVQHGFVLILGAVMPLLLGCIFAYILNILMGFLEKKLFRSCKKSIWIRLRRPVCMVLSYVIIALLLCFVIQMIVPELWNCVQILFKELPYALEETYLWLEESYQISRFLENPVDSDSIRQIFSSDTLNKVGSALFTGVGGVVDAALQMVTSTVSTLVTLVVALIFSLYILLQKETLQRQSKKLLITYLPNVWVKKLFYVLQTANTCFRSFIIGQCTEAVILGTLCVIGMLLLQLPYATMIGCLIGFTAFIPVAGAYIGAIVGGFMIFTVDPLKALIFLVFLIILQQLEGNLIYPKVVGSSIGLPGIWVLAAVTVGGGIFGILGMLIGVPLTATIYQLIRTDINKRNLS